MIKPDDYEQTQSYGTYETLELGGHVMKIIKCEEARSQSGKTMLKIYLDTDKTDKQPQFFKKQYDNDTRTDKKWGCIVYQLVFDNDGHTNRGLKTFHECVEKSNESRFRLVWGDKYCDCFKDRLIGGVFGREEYINNSGQPKMTTKLRFFRSVGVILKGVDIPEDKLLDGSNKPRATHPTPVNAMLGEVPLPYDESCRMHEQSAQSAVRTTAPIADEDYPF